MAQAPKTAAAAEGGRLEPGDPSSPQQPAQTPIAADHALVATTAPRRAGLMTRLKGLFGLRAAGTMRADLEEALSDGAAHGFTPEERAMLNNILRLREVRVEDVMVPRGDVMAVDRTIRLADLLATFEEHGHSRMPVYRESLDDPLGMVHIKDLVLHLAALARREHGARPGRTVPPPAPDGEAGPPAPLDLGRVDLGGTLAAARIMRRVLFVPPSMLAVDLMGRMQATRTQMALVIDEYGGTDGLVSLEDIVEEVVGEIEDEHDDDVDELVAPTGPGTWTADARAEIADLRAALGPGFDLGETGEEVDTLGGLVFTLAGHIPVRGEVVTGVPGYEFRITEADPRRVRRVEIVSRTRTRRRRPPIELARGGEAGRSDAAKGVAPRNDAAVEQAKPPADADDNTSPPSGAKEAATDGTRDG